MKVKEESEKAGLKLNVKKTKIMVSGSITSLETEREKVRTVTDFTFLVSKIIVERDWSYEIKRCLLLGKESYDKPKQHIKKQKHQFTNKICMVKTMVFPGVVYRCENWTIKKAKHQRIDAFKL